MDRSGSSRHGILKGVIFVLIIEAIALALFAIIVVSGHFPMGADSHPSSIEAFLGRVSRSSWVSAQAPQEKDPVAVNEDTLQHGAELYQGNCAVCHGGAHYPESKLHKAVYPGAPQFMKKPAGGKDDNLFFVIKHGIRFTGMPAWEYNMSNDDIWSVVNFVKNMGHLPPPVEAAWQSMSMSPALPGMTQPTSQQQ